MPNLPISGLPAATSPTSANVFPTVESGITKKMSIAQILSLGSSAVEVTTTSASMAINTTYIANNAGLVTLALPTTSAIGSIIEVIGKGAGGWKISQSAGQKINFGNVTTTVGVTGFISSNFQFDSIRLVCTIANTTWTYSPNSGNLNYN